MTRFDEHQEHLRNRAWTWDDMALFYEGKGTEQSILPLHDLEYLDVYERTYGSRFGANGIGRLREVALSRITEAENRVFDESLPYAARPDLLASHGVGEHGLGWIDVARASEQQSAYAAILEREGVKVHWIDWGEQPVSAYGPMHGMWVAGEVLIVNGGAIIPRRGRDPFSIGRGEWLSRWLFWEHNLPTLLTVAGKGIAEVGSLLWLAQDVFIAGSSLAYNDDGMAQALPVVERSAGVSELTTLTIHCQGERYFGRETGESAHVNNLIAPLDVDKVLCYSPGIDTPALLWLKQNGYQVIQPDHDEHVMHRPCNLMVLEPGRVVMPAEAQDTIKAVRDAGVEVIETPFGAFHEAGGGLHTATLQILRDPGPIRFTA